MTIKLLPYFEKTLKKLHKNQKIDLDKAIKIIDKNHEIGESKIGDLLNVKVYKFKMVGQLTLLAYKIVNEELILLISLGSHQNFYEDLKRLLKDIKLSDFVE